MSEFNAETLNEMPFVQEMHKPTFTIAQRNLRQWRKQHKIKSGLLTAMISFVRLAIIEMTELSKQNKLNPKFLPPILTHNSSLADEWSCSVRSVQRYKKKLLQNGFIVLQQQVKGTTYIWINPEILLKNQRGFTYNFEEKQDPWEQLKNSRLASETLSNPSELATKSHPLDVPVPSFQSVDIDRHVDMLASLLTGNECGVSDGCVLPEEGEDGRNRHRNLPKEAGVSNSKQEKREIFSTQNEIRPGERSAYKAGAGARLAAKLGAKLDQTDQNLPKEVKEGVTTKSEEDKPLDNNPSASDLPKEGKRVIPTKSEEDKLLDGSTLASFLNALVVKFWTYSSAKFYSKFILTEKEKIRIKDLIVTEVFNNFSGVPTEDYWNKFYCYLIERTKMVEDYLRANPGFELPSPFKFFGNTSKVNFKNTAKWHKDQMERTLHYKRKKHINLFLKDFRDYTNGRSKHQSLSTTEYYKHWHGYMTKQKIDSNIKHSDPKLIEWFQLTAKKNFESLVKSIKKNSP